MTEPDNQPIPSKVPDLRGVPWDELPQPETARRGFSSSI